MFTSMYKDLSLTLGHWKKVNTLDKDFSRIIEFCVCTVVGGGYKRYRSPAMSHMEPWLEWQANEERTDRHMSRKTDGTMPTTTAPWHLSVCLKNSTGQQQQAAL